MSPSKIRSAERELRAFISSMINDDLRQYRKSAEECLLNSKFLTPWVFENTPASSEALDDFYLCQVRAADVVIWVGGDHTSTPVVREINEAIKFKKRLWIFLLPEKTQRDRDTQAIIEAVSQNMRPKWCELPDNDIETFIDAFELTIKDEATRSFRNDQYWRRPGALERLSRESRARCIARFTAIGLTQNQANRMIKRISDLPVLASPEFPKEGEVSILVGALGSGKSFVAEKLYQEVLEQSISPMDPVPVFTNARHIDTSLKSYIMEQSREIGDVAAIGASIVIDQVDDLSFYDSKRLYTEALTLAKSWPKTRILIVSRPLRWIRDDVATTCVREMSLEEVENVIELVSDSSRSQLLWILPHALRQSVQRPLFAILLAKYLESNEDQVPISMAKLVRWMVRGAIENTRTESNTTTESILRSLAVKLTDGHANVKLMDLTTSVSDGNGLLNTNLVYEESERLDFALPILRQWFAFDAICRREVDIVELSLDAERLDKWEDVLTTAVELATDQIDDIIEPIVVNNPSVASVILDSAFGHLWYGNVDTDLTAKSFGRHIRRAMTAFTQGIGPLSRLIAPVNERGEVKPLGVAKLENGYYKTSWYEGSSELEEVVGISSEGSSTPRDWPRSHSRTRIDSPAWAWLDVKEELKWPLEDLIRRYGFPIQNNAFLHESAWYLASSTLDYHSMLGLEFPADELNQVYRWIHKCPPSTLERFSTETLTSTLVFLQEQLNREAQICSPWPEPDGSYTKSNWVWDPYSPERLRERIECVFTASLEIYHEIVSTWFITMAGRFPLYSLLPVYLRVYLHVPDFKDKDYSKGPSIRYYFEPTHEESVSKAVVYLDSISDRELREKARKASTSTTFSVTSSVVDVYGKCPAADQAYRWLSRGLRSINWT